MCSHLEGYVESLGMIGVQSIGIRQLPKKNLDPVFGYHLSRNRIKAIKDSNKPEVIARNIVKFVKSEFQIWNDTPTYSTPLPFETFVENFATPNHGEIKKFLRRFGYKTFENDMQELLRGECAICVNMIDHIVDQRNKIAHGDHSTAGTPIDLQEMYRLLKVYCASTDKVVGDWFKMIGCPIR